MKPRADRNFGKAAVKWKLKDYYFLDTCGFFGYMMFIKDKFVLQTLRTILPNLTTGFSDLVYFT